MQLSDKVRKIDRVSRLLIGFPYKQLWCTCNASNSTDKYYLETKLPWVLDSSKTWNAKIKLSFETKLTIPRPLCDFSQIFQQNVLVLDIWKNWWKSIFIRWRSRSPRWFYHRRNRQNATSLSHTARTKLASQCGWQDGRLLTHGHKKGEAIPMLSYTLVRKKKKVTKVAMKNLLLKKANQMLFNGLAHCDKINVEQLSICHGPTRDLGENATAKDFFNVFINDAYIDEIIWYTIAYAHLKGDRTLTTTRAKISAYLRLNFLIGIHELPQLAMYWDSNKFIGVEGLKKKWSQSTTSWLWGNVYILLTQLLKTKTVSSEKFAPF